MDLERPIFESCPSPPSKFTGKGKARLYEVLGRLEQPTPIREPEPQQFALKGNIHRNLKEVSCIEQDDSYRQLI